MEVPTCLSSASYGWTASERNALGTRTVFFLLDRVKTTASKHIASVCYECVGKQKIFNRNRNKRVDSMINLINRVGQSYPWNSSVYRPYNCLRSDGTEWVCIGGGGREGLFLICRAVFTTVRGGVMEWRVIWTCRYLVSCGPNNVCYSISIGRFVSSQPLHVAVETLARAETRTTVAYTRFHVCTTRLLNRCVRPLMMTHSELLIQLVAFR